MESITLENHFLTRIRRHLRNYKLYMLAADFAGSIYEMNKIDTRFVSLKSDKPFKGNVLFCYHNDSLFLKPEKPVSNSHTFYLESLEIGRTWLDLGYCVDVINTGSNKFHPTKRYSFFIANRIDFERISLELNEDCVKILHIDTAHWLFHMSAQHGRLLALQERRGVTLPLRKIMLPNWAIERADCATILGNEFTSSTYHYANKPMYRVPIPTSALYPWTEQKDWEACRKHFLWFGSIGLVHKGLDLVLEAFVELHEYHLTVCGPIDREKDFTRAFHKELFQTSNIRTVGWIDISSPEFIEITHNCIGLIYPSCSEGQSGGVVTCLHAGLIPIISYESGVEVADFGFILQSCSIQDIKDAIRMVASLPVQELKERARRAWEYARANHTREKFAEEYRKIIVQFILPRFRIEQLIESKSA